MKTVKDVSIKYEKKAELVELLWRIPYAIACGLVLWVFQLFIGVVIVFQLIHIIATSKRHKALHAWTHMYLTYAVHVVSYLLLLTDERPPIIPDM
ncbi:hypothetical protein COT72_05485 [archaeon CG10_big_fil_rev_8_21_14_0_10_43_11]|nr:MAG: hypothetical protein COT72_05485 [archaeon CG10_big_fil_rev_8_21_14_0_10_43_11]